MDVAVFSTKPYDRRFLDAANAGHGHRLDWFDAPLVEATTPLARGYGAVCVFVNDRVSAEVAAALAEGGVRLVALRSAGFNNVDLAAARAQGLKVVRVPAYSPHAVAEHTVALILALNRKIHRAYNRVREGNFALDGLLGFDLHGRTVGVVGTGKIGAIVVRILHGFGCHMLAYDVQPDQACARLAEYVDLDELLAGADIVTLHCPLHFQVVAVIRSQEPGRNQEQNDFGRFELLLDFGIPFGPRFDVAVLPGANFTLALEGGQMHNQIVFIVFVPMGVGDEDA